MTNLMLEAMHTSPVAHRRMSPRRPLLIASIAAVAVLAAACTSATSSPTTTKAAPTGTTASTGTSASTSSVKLASVTLPGVGSVLTGPNGMTLYYFTTDTPTSTTCTGECAVVWPPLVVPAGSKAALASDVTGALGTVTRPDGSTQVTYENHLLYYYEGDKAAGQDNGQGLEGTWFVAKTAGSAPAASPTTTAKPGGGGGGVGF
jgi:predicted lipoprotein with Yx(FWY)xxD motif